MPDWRTEIQRRLAPLRLSPAREASLSEELAQHLEDHYAELIADGTPPGSARRLALDGLARHELLREMRGVEPAPNSEPVFAPEASRTIFSGLGGDFRYSLRGLRKSPA